MLKIEKSDRVDSAERTSYIERNELMIDDSDCCVFFIDKNTKYKSGTKIALNYASRQDKKILEIEDYNI